MKRLVLLFAVVAALCACAAASAHPLGNFTINRFARVEIAGDRLYVRYVLDLAEIPTYQKVPADPRRIASSLHISLDGRRVVLRPIAHRVAHPLGAAGLHTTRLEVILRGPQVNAAAALAVHDTNYAGRIGWKEIVVGAHAPSASDELRSYPKSLLQSPLDVTSAHAAVAPTSDPVPTLSSGRSLDAPDRVADSGFTKLIGRRHLGALTILVSLALAMFWGAAHALSPGHGKSIVTAYLVGKRGTPRDAALLGATVTITHTIGVFALGLVTLALSQWIVPEQLYPVLNVVAGVSVIAIGVAVLNARLRHRHHHHHHHEHDHRSLFAVGISGGLLPCPSALVVLLAAISLHRLAFGLVLIIAFSLGLALAITGVGLVAVLARRRFNRLPAMRFLPAVSACVILAAGVAMTVNALS